MSWHPAARPNLTFDPHDLTRPQREGDACVVCHKKWPRPRVRVGRLPDDAPVMACEDCAKALLPAPPNPRRQAGHEAALP
ncbi:hypothetical protein Sme01_18140 [Sphaerisporangium melleum]|uniref:Uncharacterized protein n=1 Tax=Sphaerisporangium melleum TaxID=321316 RepID=A0A917VIR8_9ACTN|nr:hypothetical protein [Sphaerisporangium melleum]GGK83993.1 hypothetical protein GCM10007964_28080 [Sphaerisporangium melleum]GII69338.1 hypothetical protein Sme01_18140 [Sphaerisporangium melleum]